MVQIEGKYSHVKSENMDDYFKSVGVPFMARKMMSLSNPTIQISKSEDGEWTLTTTTLIRTVTHKFKLDEPYEEHMPGGVLKSQTRIEDDKMITECSNPDNTHTTRIYDFSDDGMTIKYIHVETGKQATRHFKRIQ